MNMQNSTDKKNTYGIRKLKTGVGSILLGSLLFAGLSQTAEGAEVAEDAAAVEETTAQTDSQTVELVITEEAVTAEEVIVEEEAPVTEETIVEEPVTAEPVVEEEPAVTEVTEPNLVEEEPAVTEEIVEEEPVTETVEETETVAETEVPVEEEVQVTEETIAEEEPAIETVEEAEVVEDTTESNVSEAHDYPESTNEELEVSHKSRYETGAPFDEAGTEIVQFNSKNNYLYSVNGYETSLDIIDASTDEMTLVNQIFLEDYGVEASDLTSVAINPSGEYIAVSAPAKVKTDNGQVVFFDNLGTYLNRLTVGALPDMLTFTPDGQYLLVANEGELNDEYTVNPPGGVSVIATDRSPDQLTQDDVTTVNVTPEDLPDDFRPLGPNPDEYHLNAEPEYIVVDSNSEYAYVAFQEVSAIGKFDIKNKRFEEVSSMEYKDHSVEGMGMDASDKDGTTNIKPVPVLGMYQPDAVSLYEVDGETYIVTANEGDSQDYDGYSEETRVGDIKDLIQLDAQYYEGFTQEELDALVANGLFDDDQLGRLTVTMDHPFKDGDIHRAIVAFGARSFSILRASDMQMIYDSGDEFEQQTLKYNPDWFNVDIEAPDELTMDGRSDNKGPETESVVVGTVNDQQYAFIGSERTGGFFIYNVSNPNAPYFIDYIYDASLTDISPEGMAFVSAEERPDGVPMLVIGHELSGTISTFSLASLIEAPVAEENTDESVAGIIDGDSGITDNHSEANIHNNDVISADSQSEVITEELNHSTHQNTENNAVTDNVSTDKNLVASNVTTVSASSVSENNNGVTPAVQSVLPNTGEHAKNTTLLAGFLLMIGSVLAVFRKTKKDQI